MNKAAWDAALADPSPDRLAVLLRSGNPPSLHGKPWSDCLALRVSREQWVGHNWLTPHYEAWMDIWKELSPGLDYSRSHQLPFSLLRQLGNAEAQYSPGRMHLDAWLAFVDSLVKQGMPLQAINGCGMTLLVYALKYTTAYPYPRVARHWMEHHSVPFPAMDAAEIVHLCERLMAAEKLPGTGNDRIHEDTDFVLQRAIENAHPTGLKKALDTWMDTATQFQLDHLLSMATLRELDARVPILHRPHAPQRL